MRRSLSILGRFRAILVAAVTLAVAGPAAGAVVPTFVSVTQEGGTAADCTAPLPGGAGAASATYSHFAGIGTIQTTWSVPAQITAGSQVTLGLQMNTTQGFNGLILLNAPSEFGGATAPFEVTGSTFPAGGSFSGSKTITFTPTRAFTPGEEHILRLGNGCNAFLYRYVATGTPDTPAKPRKPRISPRTTRPVPGVVTSYASPRPGKVAVLPFPAGGCTPAVGNALATQTPAGGECEVDIFVRRTGGKAIHDPDAVFGIDTRIKQSNAQTAFRICFAHAIDLGNAIDRSNDAFREADDAFRQCVLIVSRILERNDEIQDAKARKRKASNAHASHAAHTCAGRVMRLRGQAARRSPVSVLCRHTATRTRLTLRSARTGVAIGDLISPTSKLIVARSDAVPWRPGDRIDVVWRIRPPRTTTPAPGGAGATKVALTGVEAFPNPRASSHLPPAAIDGDTGTYTWSTEAYNVTHPSYLAVAFAESNVSRLRLWKAKDGGGGQLVKNLAIQYTTGTGPLSSRAWTNVSGLANGSGGAELLKATAVNADGTVTGDVHDSAAGDGFASLSFTPVRATGLRIAFANPDPNLTCSSVPGTCNHYRVGELEVYGTP